MGITTDPSYAKDIIINSTQSIADKPEFIFVHFVLDDYDFCFERILVRQHRQVLRPLVYQKQFLKASVQSVNLNCANSDKVRKISLLDILLCLKRIMRIMFCFGIEFEIPKGMSGQHFLKVSSKSDTTIMSKFQIATCKFVQGSCC